MQELAYIQSAVVHLGIALKIMDNLGANVSAAHIDAALQALKSEPIIKRTFAELLQDEQLNFATFDAFIEELFAKPLAISLDIDNNP